VADGTRLLSGRRGNPTAGSNPALSAMNVPTRRAAADGEVSRSARQRLTHDRDGIQRPLQHELRRQAHDPPPEPGESAIAPRIR
jgi:hypothetical protein